MNAHRKIPQRIAVGFLLLLFLALASTGHAAEQKLGFAVDLKGEGFFLNPIVTAILVSEVTKGGLAEAAGMRVGDEIIQLEGQKVAGMRALGLRTYMKLEPGETRRIRLKHKDGTEVDVRITKPKG
jgi:C-terminal processing protease CtpA/Prc